MMLLAGVLRVWPIQPWVFPSFSSPVDSRSQPGEVAGWLPEGVSLRHVLLGLPLPPSPVDLMPGPAQRCRRQASHSCGHPNPTLLRTTMRPLVLDLLSSTGPRFPSPQATGHRRKSGAYEVLLESFSVYSDTKPASPSIDTIIPGVQQGAYCMRFKLPTSQNPGTEKHVT